MNAADLLKRYAKGERGFGRDSREIRLRRADLRRVNLERANFFSANFQETNFEGAILNRTAFWMCRCLQANFDWASLDGASLHGDFSGARFRCASLKDSTLKGASFEEAHLDGAYLEGADLESANLKRAELRHVNLERANLENTDLEDADLDKAILGRTMLIGIDLTPFCQSTQKHLSSSIVDYTSVIRSVHAPNLKRFLRATGMPDVFAEYMVWCARSLSPTERFTLMLSTFISYGGPDEPFARKLNDALKTNGVNTFFYPLDAKLGEWNADIMHRGIREHDRVVFVCSESALSRPGVRTELNEARRKEAANGGESCLIPITIDGYVFSDEFRRTDPDLAEFLLERVVGDFRGADKDEAVFRAMLPRLADALRKQIEAAAKADEREHK